MQTQFRIGHEALAFLEHHRLAPTVENYGLAVSHLSNTDSDLSKEIAALTEGGVRLTGDEAAHLIATHLAITGPGSAESRRTLAGQAEALGALADDVRDVTQSLGDDVRHIVRHAGGAVPGGEAVVERLASAEQELADLKGQFEALKVSVRATGGVPIDETYDPLTRALTAAGGRAVFDRVEKLERRYVVAMFSIDGLVAINREYGTSVGDNVLNSFATRLKEIFTDQQAIRWSGNEFVLVIPDRTITTVRLLAEEVLSVIETRKFKLRGSGEWIGTITASAAIVADQRDEPEALLDRAREKLAAAVRQGGNRVET